MNERREESPIPEIDFERLARATADVSAPEGFTAAVMGSLPQNDNGLLEGLRRVGRHALAIAAVAAGIAVFAAVEVDDRADAETLVAFDPLEMVE